MKRIMMLVLALCCLLVSCHVRLSDELTPGEAKIAAAVSADGTKSYLILGDSIAAHFGVSERESYEYKLARKLSDEGEKWVGSNWGVSGYTSGNLVSLLTKNLEIPEKRAILENADLICISIGGNNLLHFLREHDAGELPPEGAAGWIRLSHAFNEGSEEMCTELKSDLGAIMKTIRGVNPNAVILVQNIHNVARDMRGKVTLLGKTVSPTSVTEPFLQPLVRTITDNAESMGYIVADTYNAFAESPAEKLLRREMIHPNADGHTLIAEVLFDTYQAQRNSAG